MSRTADLTGIGMTSQRTRQRLVQRLAESGIGDTAVLEAMRRVPRHLFLDEAMAHRAYEDIALPIGYQQTLSQPWVVARMSELLRGGRRLQRVLDVGSGSGYQSAILAMLAEEVYAVERIKPLLQAARRRLRQLRLRNVHFSHGDGYEGWPAKAPFDGILVAAAAAEVPAALLQQLAPGGRLVMPVGEGVQSLVLVENTPAGFERRELEAVRFVPLLPGLGRVP